MINLKTLWSRIARRHEIALPLGWRPTEDDLRFMKHIARAERLG